MTPAADADALRTAVLVVAAGRGIRAGGGVPKQYRLLGGQTVLGRTLAALLADANLGRVVVAIHPDDLPLYLLASAAHAGDPRLLPPVHGGHSRQASVRAGLEALAADPPDVILVHDGVRPFVDPALTARVTTALTAGADAAIPAMPVTDTLKRVTADDTITATVDRTSLRAVQTPQGFRFAALLERHRAAAHRDDMTDDAALFDRPEDRVVAVAGEPGNVKLTTPEDFAAADMRLAAGRRVATGIGYDVHAFGPGGSVALGGVAIAHDTGVLAHSDGDVALHALTDAVLGALGDGDIGTHFPPSEERWRGASSDRFLSHAAGLVRARDGAITHLDVTIVCEAPRVGPHRPAMRRAIAAAAGIDEDRVSIKATTSERLGFTGRKEGLAALAIATIELPR